MAASPDARTGPVRELIGRRRSGLPTPALLLNLERARANARMLADRLGRRVDHRPHAKIHKCAELARLQIAAGAKGVTVATIREAVALVDSGIVDVLIANEVVGTDKVQAVAALARRCWLSVAVDDERHVDWLNAACADAGSTVRVMLDVDLGVGRCGVRKPGDAVALAARVADSPALELRGVLGYEGHAMLIADPGARREAATEAYRRLDGVVGAVRRDGFEVPVVSAGGTGTYELAASDGLITEIRAGSYLVMDGSYLPVVPEFEIATTVLATVISRPPHSIVVDCGAKAIDVQVELPTIAGMHARPRYVAEEHLAYEVRSASPLQVGDTVELVPFQCGPTINLHAAHHVIENGEVVDVWPVLARGAGPLPAGM